MNQENQTEQKKSFGVLDAKNPTKETPFETIQRQRKEHDEYKNKKTAEINQVLENNVEMGSKLSQLEEQVENLKMTNKALDKSLWTARQSKESSQYQSETEGQIISRMAVDILKKRCRDGRYGVKCEQC